MSMPWWRPCRESSRAMSMQSAGPRDVKVGGRNARVMIVGTGAQAPQVRRRAASDGALLR